MRSRASHPARAAQRSRLGSLCATVFESVARVLRSDSGDVRAARLAGVPALAFFDPGQHVGLVVANELADPDEARPLAVEEPFLDSLVADAQQLAELRGVKKSPCGDPLAAASLPEDLRDELLVSSPEFARFETLSTDRVRDEVQKEFLGIHLQNSAKAAIGTPTARQAFAGDGSTQGTMGKDGSLSTSRRSTGILSEQCEGF